jgi:hypothetical protein
MMAYHSIRYYEDLERMGGTKALPYHHFWYGYLKDRYAIYWIDGLHIPKWFHVPIIHRLLGGADRPSNQRFGKYPNIAQRAVHWLLRLIYLPLMPFLPIVPWYARVGAVAFWGVGGAFVVNFGGF